MKLDINDFPIALALFDKDGNCVSANNKWPTGLNIHIKEATHVGVSRMERSYIAEDGKTKRYSTP
jgi:hypothetical protein